MFKNVKKKFISAKVKCTFRGIDTLENSPLLDHSHLSGIHPFMSAESISLGDVTVSI